MGRIIKYNVAKSANDGRGKTISFQTTVGYPSADTSTSTTEKPNLNCQLWGNPFNGSKDLNGTIYVNGDIYVYFDDDDIDPSDYNEDEDGNSTDTGSGSIFVQGNIESNSTYGKTLYINYPTKEGNKTDLLDILKGYDTRITNNANNIITLNNRVTTVETNLSNCHSNCLSNTTEINKLKDLVDLLQQQIDELRNGGYNPNPPEDDKCNFTMKVGSNVEKVQMLGAINETITATKSYQVKIGSRIDYIVTAKPNYTFGLPTDEIQSTFSNSITVLDDMTIEHNPVPYQTEEEKPLSEYLKVQVGAYLRGDEYNGQYEIWVKVSTDYDDVLFTTLTTEGEINDWYSKDETSSERHSFGGTPTISKQAVINDTPVMQNQTFNINNWSDPVGKSFNVQFSTGYSSGAFTGTVEGLTIDPTDGNWG